MAARKTLTVEYNDIAQILKNKTYAEAAKALVADLLKLLGPDGPEKAHSDVLDKLREQCKRGFFEHLVGSNLTKESDGIFALAGTDLELAKKVAALKTLRHLYLLKKWGGHSLWVLTLPKAYTQWATDEFNGLSKPAMTPKLADIEEYWPRGERKHMISASSEALKWAQKAMVVCGSTDAAGDNLVNRWFADEDNTAEITKANKAALLAGFKKIANGANSSKMIFTDNPTARGTKLEKSEAYVSSDNTYNVIHVESAFFNKTSQLKGLVNWARIVVHELSHSQVGTVDVEGRYAWGGIKPSKAAFSGAQAMTNADSWAWFCADCNGMLTQGDREYALKT